MRELDAWLRDQETRRRPPRAFTSGEDFARAQVVTNGDLWLRDFLRLKASFTQPAISDLEQAIRANQAGEPDYALPNAREAARLFRETGNTPGRLRAEFEETYALHRMSRPRDCLKQGSALQNSLLANQYLWLHTQTTLELSICQALAGNMGQALLKAKDAITIARQAHYPSLVLRGIGILAELKATNGNDDEAWNITRDGLSLVNEGSYPPMRAYQLYAGIAYSAERRKEWFVAVALIREANLFVDQTGNFSIQAMAHYRLAGDALMAGDRALAANEFAHADILFAAIPQTESSKAYKAYGELVLAGLRLQQNQLSTSHDLLNQSEQTLADLADPLLQLTYLKTQGALDQASGQPEAAKSAYLSALKLGESWSRHLQTDDDRLAWSTQMMFVYRPLVRLYALQEKDPLKAFQIWESYRSASLKPGPLGIKNESIPGGSSSLTNSTLISYIQFTDGLAVWVADDRGLLFRWLPVAAEDTDKKVARFHTLCSDPRSPVEELNALARELYNLLIKPVETRLQPGRKLLFETDSSLAGVPFSALRDSKGKYLIENFAVVLSPALSFQTPDRSDGSASLLHLTALIMAPSIPTNDPVGLLPLRDAFIEARDVASHFHNPTVLLGENATLARFNETVSNVQVFHFSGHAFRSDDMQSLVFAGDTESSTNSDSFLLSAKNVRKENLNQLRLVVLAACSTANGPDTMAPGPGSLVDQFLRSGVPYIVATSWDVDSSTTRMLVDAFYAALEQGFDVPEAARSAQIAVLGRSQTRHPYYWATIEFFGRG